MNEPVTDKSTCPEGYHVEADGTHHLPGSFTTALTPTGARIVSGSGHVIGEATAELSKWDAPLVAAARERIGQDVAVHVIGGISVDGRLVSVNDDETITVVDKDRRYDIALGSVAVIEGSKS